jgi:hypothetical protein
VQRTAENKHAFRRIFPSPGKPTKKISSTEFYSLGDIRTGKDGALDLDQLVVGPELLA